MNWFLYDLRHERVNTFLVILTKFIWLKLSNTKQAVSKNIIWNIWITNKAFLGFELLAFLTVSILTVCSYDVTYAFQSESTFYSCLNARELLARSKREIWSLNDCNWTRTYNHLVHKRSLNHLAKCCSTNFT